MRVLYVITGLGLGGAEKVVISLAEQIYLHNYEVKIAYLVEGAVLKPRYKDIELVPLRFNSAKDIFYSLYKYLGLLNTFQPDIVHAHMVHANIFTRIVQIFRPVSKLISTAHSNNEGAKIRMLAYRLTHCLADITTNVSKQAVLEFENKRAIPKGGMLAIYNGVDIEKFCVKNIRKKELFKSLGLNLKEKMLLAIGRLTDPKDYPNLLYAISILNKKKLFNFQVVVVGDGILRDKIEELINSLGLVQKVKLLGDRDDIPELMNAADVYVLSSKFEGLPTVLIEAMACEKFIVATDCGGSAEILGDTGILVAPQNSLALAQAIEQALVLSEQEINENGKRARKRVEDLFSLESCVSKWLELYGK